MTSSRHLLGLPVSRLVSIVFLVLTLTTGLLGAHELAEPPPADLDGRLTFEEGEAGAGVTVTLIPVCGPPIRTTCDREGFFHFEKLPVGRYLLKAELFGFRKVVTDYTGMARVTIAPVRIVMRSETGVCGIGAWTRRKKAKPDARQRKRSSQASTVLLQHDFRYLPGM